MYFAGQYDEVRTEVSNMGIIYQHAILNVGGLKAAEPSTNLLIGLFVDRKALKSSYFMLTIKIEGLDVDCLASNSQENGKLNEATLMRRGWFLQEQLLSKRSVYFGTQMYCECSERLTCEAFPEQISSNILDRNLGVAATFRCCYIRSLSGELNTIVPKCSSGIYFITVGCI